jgi:peroxiredoxin
VVAITDDAPEVIRSYRAKAGYTFTILCDPRTEVIRRFDLLHKGAGPDGSDIARPAEFYVDPSGTIRWRYLTRSFAVRATPEMILEGIDAARPR